MRGRARAVAVCAALWALAPAAAHPHEPVFVHPWLTRQAAVIFAARFPDQAAEAEAFLAELAAGATHEDDYFADGDHNPATIRSERHFFRPEDGAGFTTATIAYESSFTWGAVANPTNEWDWQDALDRYQAGDRAAAFYALGHVLHLLQDLTVPAHVHLDEHSPPNGDDFENYVWFQCSSDTACDLPLPPAGVELPELASTTEAWRETATATYWRAMYPGDLSNHDLPAGQIVGMFPNITYSAWSGVWYVVDPPVGDEGTDFFERKPGWFYFKNLEQPAASDRTAFAASTPRLMQFTANDDGEAMAVLMARDLIPLAIIDTVRLMRLFVSEAARLPPPPTPDSPGETAEGCSALRNGGPGLMTAIVVVAARRGSRRRRRTT